MPPLFLLYSYILATVRTSNHRCRFRQEPRMTFITVVPFLNILCYLPTTKVISSFCPVSTPTIKALNIPNIMAVYVAVAIYICFLRRPYVVPTAAADSVFPFVSTIYLHQHSFLRSNVHSRLDNPKNNQSNRRGSRLFV